MLLPWMDVIWYDDRVCDEACLDVWWYGLCCYECLDAMRSMIDGEVKCHARWMLGYDMIDVWLGIFDAMLIVRCMLVCVVVRYKYWVCF